MIVLGALAVFRVTSDTGDASYTYTEGIRFLKRPLGMVRHQCHLINDTIYNLWGSANAICSLYEI